MSTSRKLLSATLATSFIFAAPAFAEERFAEPGGDGPNTCLQADPCSIENAFAFATPNDVIKLLPGEHTVSADIDVLDEGLLVEPAVAGTRPIVSSTSNTEPVFSIQHGGTAAVVMRGLEISAKSLLSDTNHEALVASSPFTLSDTILRARARVLHTFGTDPVSISGVTIQQISGVQEAARLDADHSVTRNLALTVSGDSAGVTVGGEGSSLTDTTVSGGLHGITVGGGASARRVTGVGAEGGLRVFGGSTVTDAVAAAANGGTAVTVQGSGVAQLRNVTGVATGGGSVGLQVAGAPTTLQARNVIARGEAQDLLASGGATVQIDHSNFRTVGGTISDQGANQSGDPLFVNAAGLDFRLQVGSPAIDAGVADDVTGGTDRDLASRFQGAAPDLGAYEANPAAAVTPDPRPQQPQPPVLPQPQPSVDTVAPVVSRLAASAVRGRAAKVRFAVTEKGTVLVTLRKGVAGKRKGASCVKPTRKLRSAKRCTRFVTLASTRKTVTAPSASFTVGRRLGGGTYRITVTPKDAAGNVGKAVTKTFVVKKKR